MGRKPDIGTTIRKLALKLNNELPADLCELWLTPKEIQERLLHGGVDRRLHLDFVHDALQHCNPGESLLKKREQQGISYYRSTVADMSDERNELPLGQRIKRRRAGDHQCHQNRVSYNPPRDYFKRTHNQYLTQMSEALDEWERQQEEEEERRRNAPPETRTIHVQTDPPECRFECSDIDPYDGNCFMSVPRMEEFIRLSTNHAAECGAQLVLVNRDMSQGAYVKETWKCPCCGKELSFANCEMVKTKSVAPGAKFSRTQPEVNLRVVKAANLAGVNLTKTEEVFTAELGVKIAAHRNLRRGQKKVRVAIKETFDERTVENRKEHVAAVRALPGYRGDIEWTEDGGAEQHSTAGGDISMDGGGATRWFGNNPRGKQASFNVCSKVIKKPLYVDVAQSNCIKCNRALTKAIEEWEATNGKKVKPDQIAQFSTQHKGECFKTSNVLPCSAEEPQARKAARDLLLDENGKYRGDDMAIIGIGINADGDTRAPKSFIEVQNQIVGAALDDVAEHVRDKGHIMKNQNNSLFELRKDDPTFKGVHALTNQRIKSLVSDTSAVVADYTEQGVGNEEARKTCLEQIDAIVPHHCGQHHKCKQEKWCTFTKVKNQHPDWNADQVAKEAAAESNRPFDGRNMDLSKEGMVKLDCNIKARFNERTIDTVAGGGCSNLSEGFFGQNVKFTEGKRMNRDHDDGWVSVNHVSFCRIGEGNIEKTHDQVSDRLGLPIRSTEVKYQGIARKIAEVRRKNQRSEKFHRRRKFAKMKRDFMQGKIDARTRHKSGKVPLTESAKSNAGGSAGKKRGGPRKCSNCRQPGHTSAGCKMPPAGKRPVAALPDFDVHVMNRCKELGVRPWKRQKPLDLFEKWVFKKTQSTSNA